MNIVLIFAILLAIGAIIFVSIDKKKINRDYDEAIVCYSEKVGNNIIEHDKNYMAKIDKKNDIFNIPALNVNIPIPEVDVFVFTKSGKSKIYIIKIDQFRYGFRVPSLNNQVYVQQRDDYGNLIKKNGKPLLTKHKWKYCDDVVEPDVKHWEQNIMEKIRDRHKTKRDMFNQWLAPIILTVILIGGIVTINMMVKFVNQSLDRQQEIHGQIVQQAEENTNAIGNLIKKVEDKQGGGG